MTIVERRTFYAKIGNANELIEHLKTGDEALERYGMEYKTRILSDHYSGRTDRVVAEWEMDSPGEVDAAIAKAMEDPQAKAESDTWLDKLNDLIHHAEAESWQAH